MKPIEEKDEAEDGPDFSKMLEETLKDLVISGKLKTEEIEAAAKIIIYSIHVLITLCFSGNGDLTEENVYRDLELIIDYVLYNDSAI